MHAIGSDPATPGSPGHVPVLPEEVLAALDPRPGQTVADCTAGRGGHAALLAERVGRTGLVVLNDADPGNLAAARARVEPIAPVAAFQGNFAELPRRMAQAGLAADAVLADLGFASTQMEDPSRGLSFQREGPLDMRFDPAGSTSAADLVNSLGARELEEILRDFGEEREARRIVQKIIREREREPITSTSRLAAIVRAAMSPARSPDAHRIDPATRTFQALRIAVNDELGSLGSLLESVSRAATAMKASAGSAGGLWLRPGARVAVIAFHSLEDRLVKRAFGSMLDRGLAVSSPDGSSRAARPVGPSDAETERNPRARSAKLRAVRLV